jgi:hypothetical protein
MAIHMNTRRNLADTFQRLPTFLLLILILMVALILLLVFVSDAFDLPVIPAITVVFQGMNIVTPIVAGAFVASVFGIYTNVMSAEAQREDEVQKTIIGFYFEISDIRVKLSNPALLHQVEGLAVLKAMDPIYPPTGLYYLLRRELFSLDRDVIYHLLWLYRAIERLMQIQTCCKYCESTFKSVDLPPVIREILDEADRLIPVLESKMR